VSDTHAKSIIDGLETAVKKIIKQTGTEIPAECRIAVPAEQGSAQK
jgi:hypothetical protein